VATSPFEVALVETSELPAYQEIAQKALHLQELGLVDRAIAVRLGVTDKTAAKAIRWLEPLDLLEPSRFRDSSCSGPPRQHRSPVSPIGVKEATH
jgi:hypothetical protein